MYSLANFFHLIIIPPILPITISLILGILFYNSIFVLACLCSALLAYAFYVYKHKKLLFSQLILCSFFACVGAYLHHQELSDYYNFYSFIDNKKIIITGTVIDRNEAIVQLKKSAMITLAIDFIKKEDCIKKSNKLAIIYCNNDTDITVGDTVSFYNVLCKKPSSESFQHYQIKEKIASTIFDSSLHYTIDQRPSWSIRQWIWSQKTRLLKAVEVKLSSNGFRFFSSLFLGNRLCVKHSLEKTNDQFKTWGISHFLARSGLHLALFVLIWQTVFCFIPLPILAKQCIILIISCIYFILTWTSAPFTRSFALFILNKTCLFTKNSFHLLHYLTLVCCAFLLYSPTYLFFLDFQLTFALTFALGWLSQVSLQHQVK